MRPDNGFNGQERNVIRMTCHAESEIGKRLTRMVNVELDRSSNQYENKNQYSITTNAVNVIMSSFSVQVPPIFVSGYQSEKGCPNWKPPKRRKRLTRHANGRDRKTKSSTNRNIFGSNFNPNRIQTTTASRRKGKRKQSMADLQAQLIQAKRITSTSTQIALVTQKSLEKVLKK